MALSTAKASDLGTLRGYVEEPEKNDFPHRMSIAAGKDSHGHLLKKWLVELDHDSLRLLDDEVPLIAGGGNANGAITVGRILISNDSSGLHVTYDITEPGWCLTETHLAVGSLVDDIPQTSKKNPIPGKFKYKKDHDCVLEYRYTIEDWTCEETIIAAHAVVTQFYQQKEESLAALEAGLPDTVEMTVYGVNHGNGEPSYWDIEISEGPLTGFYDGFCIDTDLTMSSGTTYTAKVYSSCELLGRDAGKSGTCQLCYQPRLHWTSFNM